MTYMLDCCDLGEAFENHFNSIKKIDANSLGLPSTLDTLNNEALIECKYSVLIKLLYFLNRYLTNAFNKFNLT